MALLSAKAAGLASLDRKTVLDLMAPSWAASAAALANKGFVGIVRPGVDGAVIGILCLNDAFEDALVSAIVHESQVEGFDWATLPEEAFKNALGDKAWSHCISNNPQPGTEPHHEAMGHWHSCRDAKPASTGSR